MSAEDDLELVWRHAPAGDDDGFRLTARRGRSGRATSGPLGGRLTKLLSGRRVGGGRAAMRAAPAPFAADGRQRVIVKVGFVTHAPRGARGGVSGGGGGGKLMAHARYLERDGAGRDGEKGQFYDREHDVADDAHERFRDWARDDPRHFRLVLAPESGARIEDLRGFTRATMARVERDLGVALEWRAVDHLNTDNPHTHIVLRGVRADGVALVLPREYVSHGLREAARDVATQWLGPRGIEDERLARTR